MRRGDLIRTVLIDKKGKSHIIKAVDNAQLCIEERLGDKFDLYKYRQEKASLFSRRGLDVKAELYR